MNLYWNILKKLTTNYLNFSNFKTYQMALRTEYIEKVSKFAKGGAIAERYLRI